MVKKETLRPWLVLLCWSSSHAFWFFIKSHAQVPSTGCAEASQSIFVYLSPFLSPKINENIFFKCASFKKNFKLPNFLTTRLIAQNCCFEYSDNLPSSKHTLIKYLIHQLTKYMLKSNSAILLQAEYFNNNLN